MAALVGDGGLDLALPGDGQTWLRFEALARLGAEDLSLARLAEGHADAIAILREAGRPAADGVLGVWAADPPSGRVFARRDGDGWRLSGGKRWCSGVGVVDVALVTAHAEDGYRLFLVDVRSPGVTADLDDWRAVGMRDSATGSVTLDLELPRSAAIEPPGWYLDRRGFWIGGSASRPAGTAGRSAPQRPSRRASARHDLHQAAALGEVEARCDAMAAQLRVAAAEVDRGITGDDLRRLAWRVRAGIVLGCRDVLRVVEESAGAAALTRDAAFARRIADLPVYLAQHHGGPDFAALGREVASG